MAVLLEGGCRVTRMREGTPDVRGTLRAWRHRGRGPRFLRFGRAFIRAGGVDTRPISAPGGEANGGELLG